MNRRSANTSQTPTTTSKPSRLSDSVDGTPDEINSTIDRMNRSDRIVYADAKRQLAAIGMTITKKDAEYRVNLRGSGESTAYYTNDLAEAFSTGQAMSEQQHNAVNQPSAPASTCTKTIYRDGGRTADKCGAPAAFKCTSATCGEMHCSDCSDGETCPECGADLREIAADELVDVTAAHTQTRKPLAAFLPAEDAELARLITNARRALDEEQCDSNDAEHDALYELVEHLSPTPEE